MIMIAITKNENTIKVSIPSNSTIDYKNTEISFNGNLIQNGVDGVFTRLYRQRNGDYFYIRLKDFDFFIRGNRIMGFEKTGIFDGNVNEDITITKNNKEKLNERGYSVIDDSEINELL